MKKHNYSSWAEDFYYDDITAEANKYNLSIGVIEDACEVLHRATIKRSSKRKAQKCQKECWQ